MLSNVKVQEQSDVVDIEVTQENQKSSLFFLPNYQSIYLHARVRPVCTTPHT